MPAIVADTHRYASERFLEYFAATIRNANTRAAYMNAVADFLRFAPCRLNLGSLAEVRSIHVSAYIEDIGDRFAPQTVKQRLAALRGLFDWLARHGVLETNPAAPVRGPVLHHQARQDADPHGGRSQAVDRVDLRPTAWWACATGP